MKSTIEYHGKIYTIDLSKPIDISMPLKSGAGNPTAWYCDPPNFLPVMTDRFVGEVQLGGKVNFRDIYFNPHAHGTHTECLGHISFDNYYVNDCIKNFQMPAYLWTVQPEVLENQDSVISSSQFQSIINQLKDVKVLIIRTLPNDLSKLSKQYSHTNPTYIEPLAVKMIVEAGIEHIMIDTPSIDREEDEGKLEGHHIFWNYPDNPRYNCSITELIFVPNEANDDIYWLNLVISNFKNDAAPSRPLLYQLL